MAPAHRRDGADHSGGFSVQPARPRSKPQLQAAAAIAGLALLATAGLSPLLPSAGAEAQTYGPAAAGSTDPLGQGWSDDMRQLYYYTPQGSRLIPLSWLKALERADQPGRFVDPDHLKAFGLIYHDNPRADLNPDGLPIGFALDPGFDGADRWVGLTCSACHTGEVEAKGTRLRIDGGPSNFDFDRFYAALATAVRLTVVNPDPARFERFAAAVLGAGASQEAMAKLRTAVAEFEVRLSGDAVVRRPQVASGFGRVDALNQILNALAVSDLGIAENLRPVDAPVSYPQLWVAPKLDWVQWNPVASNPLARNLGEVLGVFGSANLRTRDATLFQSTAIVPKLAAMESWLDELKSPRWPEDLLGAIDAAKADAGKRLFERDCSGCHNLPPFRMTDKADNIAGKTFVKAGRVKAAAVGTDPNYMRSFHARTVATGPLAAVLFDNHPIVGGGEFFVTTVGALLKKGVSALGLPPDKQLEINGFRFKAPAMPGGAPEPYRPNAPPCERLDCLKAPTLLGVWATGPFLHNGSVPNVYELLSPPEERSKIFWVGGRELDVERLGFVSGEKPGLFRFDTSQPGNGNGGHRFPAAGYGHEERLAVIEYLKDPNRFAPGPRF